MALCSDARAVMRITGVSGSCSRTAASRSVPETPGILMSVSTMSGAPALSASRPALPPWAVVTSNPSPFNRIRSTSRIPISSSTTRIDGWLLMRAPPIPRVHSRPSCCLLLSAGGGEIDGKRGALPRRGVHEHQAAVRVHRALHDGEAEAGAAHPTRHERLEQAGPQALGDARAVVAYGQGDRALDAGAPRQPVGGGASGAHRDPRALARGLDGV